LKVSSESADTDDQDGMAIAKGEFFTDNDVDTDLRDGSIDMSSAGVSVGNTGSGQPVSIMQPFLGVNFIIALEGLYPSRE
jgi:microcystin-dependent protein